MLRLISVFVIRIWHKIKKSFHFKDKRQNEIYSAQVPHFMIVLIPYINWLNISFLDNKMSICEEYWSFKDSESSIGNFVTDRFVRNLEG